MDGPTCVFGEPDCGRVVLFDDSGEPWCAKCKQRADMEALAIKIAEALGDDYAEAFEDKAAWALARGMAPSRFRDVNEAYKRDYRRCAEVCIKLRAAEGDGL